MVTLKIRETILMYVTYVEANGDQYSVSTPCFD